MKRYGALIEITERKDRDPKFRYFEGTAKSERAARGVLLCGALSYFPDAGCSLLGVSRIGKDGSHVTALPPMGLRAALSHGVYIVKDTRPNTRAKVQSKSLTKKAMTALTKMAKKATDKPKKDTDKPKWPSYDWEAFPVEFLEQVSTEVTYIGKED